MKLPNLYAYSIAVQNAKSPTGLSIRSNASRTWVKKTGSHHGSLKREFQHLLETVMENCLEARAASGVTSLPTTSLNWGQMKEKDMPKTFVSYVQVYVESSP